MQLNSPRHIATNFLLYLAICFHKTMFCQRVVYPKGPPNSGLSVACRTPDGGTGDCVMISRCRSLWDSRDYNHLRRSMCGFQGDVPKVCCPHSPYTNTPPTSMLSTTPITTAPKRVKRPESEMLPTPSTTQKIPICTTNKITSSRGQERTTTTTRRPRVTPGADPRVGRKPDAQNGSQSIYPKECGKNHVTFRRIVGGEESAVGTWPWMAAIYLTRRGIKSAECGGVLVTAKHVLTAAHCMVNRRGNTIPARMVTVRLGDHDLESSDDGAEPVDVSVRKVMKHKNFDPRTFQNDIAVLELSSPVKFEKNVAPICLPDGNALKGDDVADRNAFAAGWGTISFSGPASSKLQEVQLRIWKNSDCKDVFKNDAPITDVSLCAGGDGGKDSCRGDSGGPLMLPQMDGRFYVIGIVSFGKKCAEPDYPGVYARVTSFADWIREKINATST